MVIDDDPGDSSLQQLSFWVDTLDTVPARQGRADGDSDYSDETVQITSTAVDDVWPLTHRVPRRGTDRTAITERRSAR